MPAVVSFKNDLNFQIATGSGIDQLQRMFHYKPTDTKQKSVYTVS